MYALYIANKNYSSWSLRPWVLMRTLGIPFEERMTPFVGAGVANAENFRKISPSGKVPSLLDGSILVWDSLAIAEYLNERHDGVWPAEAKARSFARSAAAEMHSGFQTLRGTCNMNCGVRVKMKSISAELRRDLARLAELFEQGLRDFGGPFLAGSKFTAADAFFCPVAYRAQSYGLDLSPTANGYLARLVALPAMQEWYAAALKETGRIEQYDNDSRAAGEWTADLRAKA